MRNKKLKTKKEKLKTQKGAVAILMSFFILTIILMIASTAATIMFFEIKMSREIGNSIPAFYAADAGAEECLFESRCVIDSPPSAECLAETGPGLDQGCASIGGTVNYSLSNGAVVSAVRSSDTQINANGIFAQTNRKVQIDWNP